MALLGSVEVAFKLLEEKRKRAEDGHSRLFQRAILEPELPRNKFGLFPTIEVVWGAWQVVEDF